MLDGHRRCGSGLLRTLLLTSLLVLIRPPAADAANKKSKTVAKKLDPAAARLSRKRQRVAKTRMHSADRVARNAAIISARFANRLRRNAKGVVYLSNRGTKTRGTAIMVTGVSKKSRRALFLTNAHTIDPGEKAYLRVGGSKLDVIGVVVENSQLDYALIEVRVPKGADRPMRVTLEDQPTAEQSIYAMGYPALEKIDATDEQLRAITTSRPEQRMLSYQQGVWPTVAAPGDPDSLMALEGAVPHHRGMSGGAYFSPETHRAVALHARGHKNDVTKKLEGEEREWTSFAVPMHLILADVRRRFADGSPPAVARFLARYPEAGAEVAR